jgi:hypothetical protein
VKIHPRFSLSALLACLFATCFAQSSSPTAAAHVSHSFRFAVQAPPGVVAPLFGPQKERAWAEGWDPQFVYPQPGADRPGAVFTVRHGGQGSTWITTAFEPENGHVQYVYLIPGIMVTVIDIRVSAQGDFASLVQVVYERTALDPGYNDHVEHLGEQDSESGAHWKLAIDHYLKARGKQP